MGLKYRVFTNFMDQSHIIDKLREVIDSLKTSGLVCLISVHG